MSIIKKIVKVVFGTLLILIVATAQSLYEPQQLVTVTGTVQNPNYRFKPIVMNYCHLVMFPSFGCGPDTPASRNNGIEAACGIWNPDRTLGVDFLKCSPERFRFFKGVVNEKLVDTTPKPKPIVVFPTKAQPILARVEEVPAPLTSAKAKETKAPTFLDTIKEDLKIVQPSSLISEVREGVNEIKMGFESIHRFANWISKEEFEFKLFFQHARAVVLDVIDFLEHPIHRLLSTWKGTGILVLLVLSLVIFLFWFVVRPSLYTLKCLYGLAKLICRVIAYPLRPLGRAIARSYCCMYFCALRPFIFIRNTIYGFVARRRDKKRLILNQRREEVKLLERLTSQLYTDKHGVYVKAKDNIRVYLDDQKQAQTLFLAGNNTRVERDKDPIVSTVKETILSSSKLYKVDKVPDFQATFQVDGKIIGHFSRIKWYGLDCMLTAFHVLDYNRNSLIDLVKGDKSIAFASVNTKIIAASRTDDLDFLVMQVPPSVFSILGMKIAKIAQRAQPREPIAIYQFYEGKPCVSSASIQMSPVKPWHINYAASTMSGSSGAPILDTKNNIIGVHLEHDSDQKINVGVIPPLFRSVKKESPTNEDIAANQPDFYPSEEDRAAARAKAEEEEWAGYDEKYEKEKIEEDEYMEILYASKLSEFNDRKQRSWADEMDEVDEQYALDSIGGRYRTPAAERLERKDKHERFVRYRANVYAGTGEGGHVGSLIKNDRYRKESPWTCSKCFCIHETRAYTCSNCGFALQPVTKKSVEKLKQSIAAAAEVVPEYFPDLIAEKIMGYLKKEEVMNELVLGIRKMFDEGSFGSAKLSKRIAEDGTLLTREYRHPVDGRVPQGAEQVNKVEKIYPVLPMTSAAAEAYRPGRLDADLFASSYSAKSSHPPVYVAPTPTPGIFQSALIERVPGTNKVEVLRPAAKIADLRIIPGPEDSRENTQGPSKKKKRNRPKRSQKETIPAVPLNSIAPERSGGIITSGANQLPSPTNLKSSALAALPSQDVVVKRKARRGRRSKAVKNALTSTVGQVGQPLLSKLALNSNATNTLPPISFPLPPQ